MNRIVKDHYPAAKLPEDLREGIDPAAEVVVTVEEVEPKHAIDIDALFARRCPPFRSSEEIVQSIREGRDEPDE